MACSNLTAGLVLDCNDGVGGIESIFIANGPVTITETGGVVSAISDGSPLTPSDFFKFDVPRQTSSFTETINPSLENGTLFYNQDLTIIFNRIDTSKRNQILLMAQATHMVVVFKDNNGKYFSVGLEEGAYMSAGSATSGVAYGDRNGFEITISGIEKQPSYEVAGSIVEA